MADYKAPSSLKAIEAFKDEATRDHLLRFGRMLTGSEADAEDLLADAMESVCDPENGRPWGDRGTFRMHMRIVMTDLAKRKRRSAYARREVATGAVDLDEHATRHPLPDEILDDARLRARLQRLGAALRERLRERPRALEVLDREVAGVETPTELAHNIGCSVDEVHAAKEIIAYHAARVLAEDEKAETARMKELRARAKKKEV